MPSSPQPVSSPLALDDGPLGPSRMPATTRGIHELPKDVSEDTEPAPKPYVSKIGILPSSLPYYHNQYMELLKKEKAAVREKQTLRSQGEPLDPHEAEYFSKLSLDNNPKEQTPEEQAATSRRLKPHSRSTLQLQYITSQPREKTEDPTQAASKKNRTRWQFGIRSRNLPHEAIHCVYKALAAQKAQWEVPMPPLTAPAEGPKQYPVNIAGATSVSGTLARGSESPEEGKHGTPHPTDDYMYDFNFEGYGAGEAQQTSSSSSNTETARDNESDDDIDPAVVPTNYVPKDPWCIKVRWRKDGMYPPGTIHPSSAHSSRIDLSSEASRRTSMIGSMSSATASTTSVVTGPTSSADGACYVYMDVQLYTLEPSTDKQPGTFLVDFKCAGYESVVEHAVSETEKMLVGSGVRVKDKDVTSPQPFLDLTNKLVIYLAGGGN